MRKDYFTYDLSEGQRLVMMKTKANRKWQVYIVGNDILDAPDYLLRDGNITQARAAVAEQLKHDVLETT